MKLSDYAKKLGVTYRTAWNWYAAGKIPNAMKTRTCLAAQHRPRHLEAVKFLARAHVASTVMIRS